MTKQNEKLFCIKSGENFLVRQYFALDFGLVHFIEVFGQNFDVLNELLNTRMKNGKTVWQIY